MLEPNMTRKRNAGGAGSTYRYFRMWITARNEAAAITVGEWELYDNQNVNRALGKNATASNAEFGAAYGAVDGVIPANLTQGRWQTNVGTHPQWLQIDLGAVHTISLTSLYVDSSQITNYADYSPRNWIFQGSLDGTTWNDILTVSGQTTAVWKTKRRHDWVFPQS